MAGGAFGLGGFNADMIGGYTMPAVGASAPVEAAIAAQSAPVAAPGAVAAPGGIPPVGGVPGSTPLGLNTGTFNLALGGIQALGNIWNAWEANKLAKKQFAYQKDVTEQNLANQMQSYNTTLEDRIGSRAAFEQGHNGGMQRKDVGGYLDKHKLVRRQGGAA